jgi:hypothetical protein
LSPDVARPALANHLVEMAQEGVNKEDELAAVALLS